ncbi:MAG: TetR/AcrR family transcriptional regulator [Bacteroidota bacterium]
MPAENGEHGPRFPSSAPAPSAQSAPERILRHARGRFLKEGFSRIPVEELASDLRISKRTFYRFYAGKEDLLERILENLLEEVRTGLDLIREGDAPFAAKLSETMAFVGRLMGELGRPFLRDIQVHAPRLWERIREFRKRRIQGHFGALIRGGMQEGWIRGDVNAEILLTAYLAAVDAVVNPEFLSQTPVTSREALEDVITIVFHGVLTPEARARSARPGES